MTDLTAHLSSDHYEMYKDDYSEFIQIMYQCLARLIEKNAAFLKITVDSISYATVNQAWIEYRSFVYPPEPEKHKEYRLDTKLKDALKLMLGRDKILSRHVRLETSKPDEVVCALNLIG